MKSSPAATKKSNKSAKAAKAGKSKKSFVTQAPEKVVTATVEKSVAAEPVKPAKKVEKTTESAGLSGFRKLNLWLAGIYALQGVAIIVAGVSKLLPVSAGFVSKDNLMSDKAGETMLATGSHHLFDINLGQLVATFLLVSAAIHLVAATAGRKRYEANLAQGFNNSRWFQFAIAGGTMLTAIAVIAGITDLAILVLIMGIQIVAGLLGLAAELFVKVSKQVQRLLCYIGCIAAALPWIAIGLYLGASAIFGTATIPAYIYATYGVSLAFFIGFALIAKMQHKKQGKWADYLYGERVFMVAALAAQSAAAWLIFAGALRS